MTISTISPAPPTVVPARRLHWGRMLAVLLAAPFMAQADGLRGAADNRRPAIRRTAA